MMGAELFGYISSIARLATGFDEWVAELTVNPFIITAISGVMVFPLKDIMFGTMSVLVPTVEICDFGII